MSGYHVRAARIQMLAAECCPTTGGGVFIRFRLEVRAIAASDGVADSPSIRLRLRGCAIRKRCAVTTVALGA